VVRLQSRQRTGTGGQGACSRGVLGQHFGDQENFIPTAGDSSADHFFGLPSAVHFGGIDVIQAQLKAAPQSIDGLAEIFMAS
jgi:hypothetical protein